MPKIFYDYLIVREDITSLLDSHDIDEIEKAELIDLIDETLHHHALNVILSHLPEEHHAEFMSRFTAAPHDEQLLAYLKEKIQVDIEAEIRKQADRIKKEILAEITKSKRK
jgi:hypothetical protein